MRAREAIRSLTLPLRDDPRGLGKLFLRLFLLFMALSFVTSAYEERSELLAHAQRWDWSQFLVAWVARVSENVQSEFLQNWALITATGLWIHEGSAESRDSDDRLESKLDALLLSHGHDPKDFS